LEIALKSLPIYGRSLAQWGKVQKREGSGLVIKEIGRQRTDPKRIRWLSISLPQETPKHEASKDMRENEQESPNPTKAVTLT